MNSLQTVEQSLSLICFGILSLGCKCFPELSVPKTEVSGSHLSLLTFDLSPVTPFLVTYIFRSDSLEYPACQVFLSLLLGEHYQEHWDLLFFERISRKVCTQWFFTVQVHPERSDTVFPTDL